MTTDKIKQNKYKPVQNRIMTIFRPISLIFVLIMMSFVVSQSVQVANYEVKVEVSKLEVDNWYDGTNEKMEFKLRFTCKNSIGNWETWDTSDRWDKTDINVQWSWDETSENGAKKLIETLITFKGTCYDKSGDDIKMVIVDADGKFLTNYIDGVTDYETFSFAEVPPGVDGKWRITYKSTTSGPGDLETYVYWKIWVKQVGIKV